MIWKYREWLRKRSIMKLKLNESKYKSGISNHRRTSRRTKESHYGSQETQF